MKYWVIGLTAALTLLAAGPIQHTKTAVGPALASIDYEQAASN